ncbi:unnamed protein product, partial [Musa textilis]
RSSQSTDSRRERERERERLRRSLASKPSPSSVSVPMEGSRSRSGGSSEQSADALGDRPRRGAPFADRLGDYAEIFADRAGSISIPFLDLPPALDGFDAAAAPVRTRGAGFDYSDVFGGVDSGESAALHDELFAAPELEETCSSKGRGLFGVC